VFQIVFVSVKVKQSHYRPGQAPSVPGGWVSQILRQSAHEGSKYCQPYAPAAFTPQKLFVVLISVRGWVNPKAIVRPKRLCQWKIPVTLSRIEPATFLIVAQCHNQLRHCVPRSSYRKDKQAKPSNLQRSNAVLGIAEQWTKSAFTFGPVNGYATAQAFMSMKSAGCNTMWHRKLNVSLYITLLINWNM
jgi:hypothetical protein